MYGPRQSRSRGPITLYAIPNHGSFPRLGLSIGRRVGAAVRRNAIKRRLREAFRLAQSDLPASLTGRYDYVVVARPHEPMATSGYVVVLLDLAGRLDADLRSRA